MSNVRLRRLQADYEKLRAFLSRQPRIRLIQSQGSPPERYQLEFQIRGLREVDDQLQTVANHMVEIALPLSYPRLPPQCRMLTPVFHPNIAPHAICIGDHWNAGEPLWSMVARIGEMIAYQSYNTKSPLNGEAARWVESNLDKLPLDKTNFMLDDAQPAGDFPDSSGAPAQRAGADGTFPLDGAVIPFASEHAPLPTAATRLDLAVRPPTAGGGGVPSYASPPPLPSKPAPPPGLTPSIPVARPIRSSGAPPMAIPLPPRPNVSGTQPASRANELGAQAAAGAVPNGAAVPDAPAKIIIQCGQCGSRYSVSSVAAGKKVRCKKCQGILVVPAAPSQP